MKKFLAFVIVLTILVSVGTAVFAYPMPQDIGNYTNYAFNIHGGVTFPTIRYMQFPASYGVHNNASMTSGYFTTCIKKESGDDATGTKTISNGQRITLSYYSANHTEYGYRLNMINQAYYGNSATGSWAPNDNCQ